MVSVGLLAAIGTPIVIILFILLLLVIGSRSSISKLQKDVNRLKDMKKDVDINSEAVDLMIPWIEAAQETFQIEGFGAY